MDILQAKKGCLYLIGHLCRPGVMSFLVELEDSHYGEEPMSELFALFNITYEGGLHLVIEIPASTLSYRQAEIIAENNGLKLVNGKPFNGIEEFPVQCLPDACFVLENKEKIEITLDGFKEELKTLHEKKCRNS